ncbi:MAG: methionyl-tRNA formyltransferase [Candidatus Rokubacteria bacterium]|nr:methionyl-tRNA formyltransferase [Candidatus Rokubacteria bacterium]MBI3824637.1 methionyl-tRNA formyltransferase [Candidatus Rokubacteria bacterium]
MKVLFYGTPEFALPTFEALLAKHQVVGVVTQPDRPAGRGQKLLASAVKVRATEAGVPVVQPARVRDPGWAERLAELGAEVAVVVAFGQILPKAVLDVPRRGSINVHASLLPRYRGAAPVAWAIIRGETVTGITTMQMDEGLDTGAILRSAPLAIEPAETAGELAARLASLGATLLVDTLATLDVVTPTPQRHEEATLAPRLKKSDGYVQWARAAREVVNLVRGCNPWPGALTATPAGPLHLWRARAVPAATGAPAGTLVPHDGTLVVATADEALLPLEVQAENRRAVAWPAYLRGARLGAGARLTTP